MTNRSLPPMLSVLVFSVAGAGLLLTAPSQRGALGADVVINEINYHPLSDLEQEEFIELWNFGATAVDLDGWAFTDGVRFTFSSGTTLGADQYLVVAKDPAALAGLASGTVLGPWSGGLQNDGEWIRLEDDQGRIVDQVRYNDAPPWPTTPDGRGASLERISPTEPGNDPANWTAATKVTETGWVKITQTGPATSSRLYIYMTVPGQVLVDDVEIVEEGFSTNLVKNPGFEQPFAGGDGSAGWTATGNHAMSDRELNVDAHSGSYLCRIRSFGVGNSYSNSVNQYTQPLITDGRNYVLSFWVKKATADASITARLSGGGLRVTHSFAQSTVSMTPGRVNSAYQADLPPFADPVAHVPECPKPSEPVTVSATIRDTDGVTSASLLYQTLRYQGGSRVISGITAVPMTRTSGTAQVGLWSGQIPAQPDRTLVRYRVKAEDSFGASRIRPDPTDARLTFSYFQYADDIVSSLPVVFLYQFGDPTSQNALRGNYAFIARPPGPSRWEVRDHLVRTARDNGHNIFFLNHHEWDGMSSINVIFDEKPRYALSEYLTFEVHRALGSLAEKAGHFRFFENDIPRGYMLMFEQPNKTFIGRNGLDNDGNLYKIRWNAPPEKKTNITLGNADIVAFQNNLGSLHGTALTDYLLQNTAVDQLINYYVGCQLTSDWDGYFNNHFLYHDIEGTGVWYKIPWDKDKTWGDNDAYRRHPSPDGYGYLYPVYDMPILFGANGTPRSGLDSDTWWRGPGWLSGPFLADPVIQRRYLRRLQEATLHMFTVERWIPIIDALEARLEPEVVERANALGRNVATDLAIFHNNIESLRQQVINRRAFILGEVDPLTIPAVQAVEPVPWTITLDPPAEIVIRFTEPISTATVGSDTVRLVRSGGDNLFGQANDVAITPSSPPQLVSPEEVRLSLAGLSLPPDRYRITVVGSGGSPIRDMVGNALDGEFTDSFPSGDGTAGGDFVSYFMIVEKSTGTSERTWPLYE